jgi:hypothetical protein
METLLAFADTTNGKLPETGNALLCGNYNQKVPVLKQKLPG